MAAALVGALISGVGMYVAGTHAQDPNNFAPLAQPGMSYYTTAPQQFAAPAFTTVAAPAITPVAQRSVATPRRTVYRSVEPAAPVVHRSAEVTPKRSKAKTALLIGGSAAGGAGLGGLIGGGKGALVGAALGGGAASIYEATRR